MEMRKHIISECCTTFQNFVPLPKKNETTRGWDTTSISLCTRADPGILDRGRIAPPPHANTEGAKPERGWGLGGKGK